MNFLDIIDPKKIEERRKERKAEWLENNPDHEKIQQQKEQERQAIFAARERGKVALGIIREETGSHYRSDYFDADGQRFSLKDLEEAGKIE